MPQIFYTMEEASAYLPNKQPLEHIIENLPENLEIYKAQKVRLSGNSEFILRALLEGQRLDGATIARLGITIKGINEKETRHMLETRKRFAEISEAGFHLEESSDKSGVKTKWIAPDNIESYKQIFESLKK